MKAFHSKISQIALVIVALGAFVIPADARRTIGTPIVVELDDKLVISSD